MTWLFKIGSFIILLPMLLPNPPIVQVYAQETLLDGVCKDGPTPAGYVAVGEMESAECAASSPGKKNAWLIDRVKSGIVSCIPPDYEKGYPPAISYMSCERVQSEQCPPSFDGTPNAYRLTKLVECQSSRVKSTCWTWSINKNAALTSNPSRYVGGSWPPFDPNKELEFYKLSIEEHNAYCSEQDRALSLARNHGRSEKDIWGEDSVHFLFSLKKGEMLPLCAEFNSSLITDRLPQYNKAGYDRKILIVRQYYSADCPAYVVNNVEQSLNAIVVKRVEREEWLVHEIFACSSTLQKTRKVGVFDIPGMGGKVIRNTAAEDYEADVNYNVRTILHDDRCGTGDETNSYYIDFASTQEHW